MKEQIVPYSKDQSGKKQQIARMFDDIAGSYDFLNHFLSLGIDITWRRKVVKKIAPYQPKTILDIATGTGDLAIDLARLNPERIIGSDIAEKMLAKGRSKISKKGLSQLITLEYGDSENLTYPDEAFDAITAAFGVRNFEHLDAGLAEMYRVLKPGGVVGILEFSQPSRFPLKQLYQFYFKNVLPFVGRFFSKNKAAYSYLPASVYAFPSGNGFLQHLEKNGFKKTKWTPLTAGICSIYTAEK